MMENLQGAIVQQEQLGQQMVPVETQASAVAAQAKAAVEARWIVAMRQPRNLDQVRAELLRECKRPSFAEVARYRKPVGGGIEGLSIRFVEQAMQLLGNCDSEAITVYDDNEKRILEVRVTDYERNVCHRKQITISKTVERRQLRNGQSAIGRRTNSSGQTVYIVEATDDELLNKEAALVSKAIRTCGLRLIPGWLQDEAEEAIKKTAIDKAAKDPDAERKRMVDAFDALNVTPRDIEEYLGHELAKISPAQIVDLRAVHAAIRDGQTSWHETIEFKRAERGDAPVEAKPAGKGAKALKEKLGGES